MKLMAEREYLVKKAQEDALSFNERILAVRNECIYTPIRSPFN